MKKIIIIIVIIAALLGGYALYYRQQKTMPPSDSQPEAEIISPEELLQAKEQREAISTSKQPERYSYAPLGFSFDKPQGYTIGVLQDGASQAFVVQSSDENIKNDFQIYVTPLSEPVTLTPDFIVSDLPGTEVSQAKKILLDGKASGIMFSSNSSGFGGKSFEIWFIYANQIYQVSSYREFSGELASIIGTWRFSK